MSSQREFLIESRDTWQEQAKYCRSQFLGSFAIAASGLTLAGVGIGTIINGNVVGGAIGLAAGSAIAITSGKEGLGEVQDFADMTARTAIRQHEIDQLAE